MAYSTIDSIRWDEPNLILDDVAFGNGNRFVIDAPGDAALDMERRASGAGVAVVAALVLAGSATRKVSRRGLLTFGLLR